MTKYDICIIGGGISGLYLLYHINKHYPEKKCVLIESRPSVGGRIYTYKDKYMQVEEGAGRISSVHHKMLDLLMDLNLYNNLVANGSNSNISDKGNLMNASILQPAKNILINASLSRSKESLSAIKFQTFIREILGDDEYQAFKAYYGYYSELILMNAWDGIQQMRLMSNTRFYSFRGGLSQITKELYARLKQHSNNRFLLRTVATDVKLFATGNYEVKYLREETPIHSLEATKVVFAAPVHNLLKFAILKPIHRTLRTIREQPLCRIYAKYPKSSDGHIWFEDIVKTNVNSMLRMVIPIDYKSGVIMISYTDGFYANYWKKMHDEKGMEYMYEKIHALLTKAFPDVNQIPYPVDYPRAIKMSYWKTGVGYWTEERTIGYTSEEESDLLICPVENIYVCGENVASKNQQWMEGALDTATKVLHEL